MAEGRRQELISLAGASAAFTACTAWGSLRDPERITRKAAAYKINFHVTWREEIHKNLHHICGASRRLMRRQIKLGWGIGFPAVSAQLSRRHYKHRDHWSHLPGTCKIQIRLIFRFFGVALEYKPLSIPRWGLCSLQTSSIRHSWGSQM